MEKEILSFTIPVPKIGTGKYKNQLALINNSPNWLRYNKTKIMQSFKQNLIDWHIPISKLKLKSFKVEFRLLRHNNKKLDSDAPFFCYKWIIDTIVKQGYAEDDDKVKLVIIPSIKDNNIMETSISVKVFKWKHI